MTRTIVQYQVRPDRADENQRLIEAVFAELASLAPGGVRYAAYRLEDGVTFVHVVDEDDGVLATLPAFAAFRAGFAERTVSGPTSHTATLVGAHRPTPATA